jgi:hypothetical protein
VRYPKLRIGPSMRSRALSEVAPGMPLPGWCPGCRCSHKCMAIPHALGRSSALGATYRSAATTGSARVDAGKRRRCVISAFLERLTTTRVWADCGSAGLGPGSVEAAGRRGLFESRRVWVDRAGDSEHDPVIVIHDAVLVPVGKGRQLQRRVGKPGHTVATHALRQLEDLRHHLRSRLRYRAGKRRDKPARRRR